MVSSFEQRRRPLHPHQGRFRTAAVKDGFTAAAEIPAGQIDLSVTYFGRTMHVEAALNNAGGAARDR